MAPVKQNSPLFEEGAPKICVPVTGKTEEEILLQAKTIAPHHPDLVEWRCDFFEASHNLDAVKAALIKLQKKLAGVPVLFTFRTQAEGGNKAITPEEYQMLNQFVLETGAANFIDIERQMACNIDFDSLIQLAHSKNIQIIGSYHSFSHTPPVQEMVDILTSTKKIGADIPKLAVMPQNMADVLNLLEATHLAKQQVKSPIITMSMGAMGVISRVSGEIFGSALTFATVTESSAPGQMALLDVAQVLQILHKYRH